MVKWYSECTHCGAITIYFNDGTHKAVSKNYIKDNDIVVDATIGNGNDTLYLSKTVESGKVFGFDIQDKAKPDFVELCRTEQSSAEPQRKKGKWTEKEVIYTDEAKEIITEWQSCKCSVCGRYHTQPYMYYFDEPRFCSWCGAEIVKGEADGHN